MDPEIVMGESYKEFVDATLKKLIESLNIPPLTVKVEMNFASSPINADALSRALRGCVNCDGRDFWRLGHMVTFNTMPCPQCVEVCLQRGIVIRFHFRMAWRDLVIACRPLRMPDNGRR